jgi:hypothetical protein
MRVTRTRWSGRALCTVSLSGLLLACDFINPVEENPNTLPAASLDQLLVAVTLGAYGSSERVAIWLQHLDGTSRQHLGWSKYSHTEDFTSYYGDAYSETGLVSARLGIEQAEQAERRTYAGVFKVYEAFFIGRAASVHGDVPYSEAVNPDILTPRLDEQKEVYEAVLRVLDEALADLESGEGVGPPAAMDLVYGGDLAKWIAAAHSLKARLHLHWVEVDGEGRYDAAFTEAQQGIRDAGADWLESHTTAAGEANPYYGRGGSDRRVAGEYLVELLKARADPRLPYYYSEAAGGYAGTYIGSPPGDAVGDPGIDASRVACARHSRPGCPGIGYGTEDLDLPILTCAENYFIMAEARAARGDDDAARIALDDALGCVEDRWTLWGGSVDLSVAKADNDALSGDALFDEVMEQKYIALFHQDEIWNDYKRNCRPRLVTYNNEEIPGRFLYPIPAREANPNIPVPDDQPPRNDNDPDPCPSGP